MVIDKQFTIRQEKERGLQSFLGRRQLLRTLLTVSGLGIIGCEKDLSFSYEEDTEFGKARIYLPSGEKHPEIGMFTVGIYKRGLLTAQRLYEIEVGRRSIFRLLAHFDVSKQPKLEIKVAVGREGDRDPRDTWLMVVENVDYEVAHTFVISWKNWLFYQVIWDGQVADVKRPKVNSLKIA